MFLLFMPACALHALPRHRSARSFCSNRNRCFADSTEFDDDWAFGEFQARTLPESPSAELEPITVLSACFRGLQFVDVPHANAGLEVARRRYYI